MTLETAVQNVGVVEALYEMAVDEGTMLFAIILQPIPNWVITN